LKGNGLLELLSLTSNEEVVFKGILDVFSKMVYELLNDPELIHITLETEIKFFLVNVSSNLQPFMKHFKD
jgi:hypothetical protein